MAVGAVRWSCARCKVSTGRMDGEPSALPDTWNRAEEDVFCLSCSRARAGDAAMDLAAEETPREDLVRLRRTALIQFEIGRAPDASNRAIAVACRTSTSAVAAVRTQIEGEPTLDPGLQLRQGS